MPRHFGELADGGQFPVEQNANGDAFAFRVSDDLNGVRETMALMRQLVRNSRTSPSIIGLARAIVNTVPEKAWFEQIRALHGYVRDRIKYVLDPVDVELLATPERIALDGVGDCDEKSVLLSALLQATGHPSRFVAVGFQPGDLSHVYVEAKLPFRGLDWIPLETTEPVAAGELPFAPDSVRERWIVNI